MNNKEIIKMFYECKGRSLPINFWSKDSFKIILNHLINDVYNYTEEDIYKNVNQKFFKENKLNLKVFPSIYEALNYSLPELKLIPWKFKLVSHGFWDKLDNRIWGMKWLIEELLKDKVINNIDDLPFTLRQKHLVKYRLSGLIDNMCNKNENVYDLLNIIYPNKWKISDFKYLKKGYSEMNKVEVIKFIRNFFKDHKTREELLNINLKTFKENNLEALLSKHFNHSPTYCIIECFPEYHLLEWEFQKSKGSYWSIKDNRIKALKNLIENKLKLEKENIPSIISYRFLENNFYKFRVVLDKYYNSNVFIWINEAYPDTFKESDFSSKICTDGTKVISKEEMIIHNFLVEHINKEVKYIGTNRSYIFKNEIECENYVPDWIINGNTIVEYFGLYYPTREGKVIKAYVEKTKRKIEFFTNYCSDNPDYMFIPIFPDDLKKSLKGLRQKILSIS